MPGRWVEGKPRLYHMWPTISQWRLPDKRCVWSCWVLWIYVPSFTLTYLLLLIVHTTFHSCSYYPMASEGFRIQLPKAKSHRLYRRTNEGPSDASLSTPRRTRHDLWAEARQRLKQWILLLCKFRMFVMGLEALNSLTSHLSSNSTQEFHSAFCIYLSFRIKSDEGLGDIEMRNGTPRHYRIWTCLIAHERRAKIDGVLYPKPPIPCRGGHYSRDLELVYIGALPFAVYKTKIHNNFHIPQAKERMI